MKLVQINATCGAGSTGKICVAVSKELAGAGIENHILYSSGTSDYPLGICYMEPLEIKFQALRSRVFGNYGFNSRRATKRLLDHLDRLQPDVIHLHNMHGHNCDLEMLLEYIRERKIKLFWTFHDCWVFTGYCPHFAMVGCSNWKTACGDCPQRRTYSWFFDRSRQLQARKKAALADQDLTIITPSRWLADLVKESFLGDYPVKVLHNGIDLAVFRPRESDFRQKHGLEDKFIVLGVAFGWGPRKGLDVFLDLANRLDDRFQIVLVGTDDAVDRQLPANILSVHRTQNQQELAELYTAADVFVIPTREDNFPTVNLESLACGTPVITFDTGGSPESLDETCGIVVPQNDVDAMEEAIRRVCLEKPFSPEACRKRAEEFDQERSFAQYLDLYRREL
ncbi:MAG: glycosyltransferase [Ruminiclostridium sp.]|nr:glycosyltransferase [Ruminiclostridium sp.]